MDQDLTAEFIVKDEVQRRILEVLLEEARKKPWSFGVHRSVLKQALNISEKSMDFNMCYLKKRNFVSFVQVPNCFWLWAKITRPGIAAIENTQYEEQLKDIEIGEKKTWR